MSRTTMDLFILLTVFQLMSSNEAFNFSCPSQAHWTLLSKSMCIPARYYTCLYDVTLQVNAYRHRCSRPRSLEAGHKYVFQPNLNKAACSITRYQPLFFDTVGNSDCVFLKSVCNSEGQKTDGKGNTISDRTCICNIYNGYTFVEDKGNRSTCNPSVEDCSCYVGIHPKNRTICSKDMKCSVEIELMPGSSPEERINISSKIIEFDSYKYNVVYLTNGYRTKAAVPVIMLLVFLVAGGAYIQRKRIITPIVIVGAYNQRKRTNTPSEPRVPFGLMVTNWSDASITISWNWKKYEKKQSGFIVKYRHKGTGWVSEVTAVPCKKFEHTLQGLRPETLYEIKVTSRNRNIRSKFSTALNQCTRKAAPTRFDITGCSHCSITVEWYNKDPNDHQYELVYRQESKDWVVLTLSKLEIQADEIGHYKYTLQNLLPEAGYEMKLCSITNNIKSQYSDSKRKDTLKLVLPEAISRLPEDDRTKYTNLLQSSKTEKRFYVRTIIVGKHRIGKTCLLRRLLKEDISDVVSTDGIDILLRRCKINIEDGKWIIDKEFKDDRGDRIQRAVMEMQNKKHEIGNRIVVKANHKQPKVKNSKPSDNESKENNDVSQLATLDEQKKYKNSEIYSVKNDELNPNVPDNHIPPGKKPDTEDGREIVVPFDLKSNSPVVEKAKKDTTSDQNARYHDKFSINDHTKSKDTDSRSNVNTMKSDSNAMDIEIDEANENVTPTSLVIPQDLMSHVFSEKTSNISPSNLYAFCELWDFAGQKEFYATHQAFLSSSAIYLVVADMADDINQQDIKQHFAEYGDVGGYVDFWFNSIHCHRTMKSPPKDPLNSSCDPPILLVFTGKDKYNEVQFVERKRKLNKQLDDVFGLQSKYHHLRYTFYLSNTTDSDEKFDELRNAISATAKEMNNWGESLPLKWILLEHLIGINKDAGKNFINLTDMMSLAKHSDININDINELFLFLRFQHEVGNIIFFHNIQDLIILNPKWLIDALRCLVSDRYDSAIQHTSDWTQFARYGKLSESLVSKLFQSKPGSQFSGQKGNLCQIMEKLDILVKIEDMRYYIMPSMMPSSTFEKVCENMGIRKSNCKRTSWFCLKFEFLPPSFYNHFSSWFIKNYNPSKIKIGKKKENSDKESLALYRGICMFDIDSSGCEKILVTMSTDTIALQILSFSEKKKKFSMCSIFRRELLTRVKHLSDRYNVQVCFDLHFKCNTGDYNADTKSYADLKGTPEYYCTQHQAVHRSEVIYLPWMCKEDELSEDVVNYLRLVALLHVAEDAVRLVFNDEFSRSRISRWISENFCQLTTLYRQKVLLEHQWNFLRSCMQRKDIDSSEQFDLHLMLCLLKNFTQLDICNNPRILVNSLDVSECLSTIWYYRTQVNHNVNGTIPNINFQEDLVKISQAIESLSKPRDGLLVLKCQKLQKCRLDDKNEISKEESNYLRIVHFITHVATKVVRKCFDVEFSDSLHDALKQRYSQIEGIRKWIGDQQFAMLYPTKGEVSSCTLDIRTMAILMKYLKGIHLDRFLSDIDPNSNYCADLSRLWWYSREIIFKRKFTMDEFRSRWVDISRAVISLGGESYFDLCNQLKMIPLYGKNS